MIREQAQQSLSRIDQALSQLSGVRETHVILTKDLARIQEVCNIYFTSKEEPEDGGTNIIPIGTATGDEDSEGSGDSV